MGMLGGAWGRAGHPDARGHERLKRRHLPKGVRDPMATDPMPDPINQLYERVHHQWSSDGDNGEHSAFTARSGGNQMLAVAALLAEVALRYDDLDRRLHALEDRLDAMAD
jgi:hypothetical protein